MGFFLGQTILKKKPPPIPWGGGPPPTATKGGGGPYFKNSKKLFFGCYKNPPRFLNFKFFSPHRGREFPQKHFKESKGFSQKYPPFFSNWPFKPLVTNPLALGGGDTVLFIFKNFFFPGENLNFFFCGILHQF